MGVPERPRPLGIEKGYKIGKTTYSEGPGIYQSLRPLLEIVKKRPLPPEVLSEIQQLLDIVPSPKEVAIPDSAPLAPSAELLPAESDPEESMRNWEAFHRNCQPWTVMRHEMGLAEINEGQLQAWKEERQRPFNFHNQEHLT